MMLSIMALNALSAVLIPLLAQGTGAFLGKTMISASTVRLQRVLQARML